MEADRATTGRASEPDLQAARERIASLEVQLAAASAGPSVPPTLPVAYLERSGDAGHAVVRLSRDIISLVGHAPVEFLTSPRFWEERVHPDDWAAVRAGLAALAPTGVARLTYRFRCADGGYRRLLEDLRLLEDDNGQPRRILGSLTLAPEPAAGDVASPAGTATGRKAAASDPRLPAGLDLRTLLNREQIQSMMLDFQRLTGIVFAILDPEGTVLVASGWRDVCTRFHRAQADSARHCTQSDLHLAAAMRPGTYSAYKCRNGLWDVVTPLFLGGRHLGNIYTGQFFFDDETVDMARFEEQAVRCGYDREAYLEAVARVPRVSRERIREVMAFLVKFTRLIAATAARSARLAKIVAVSRRTTVALRDSERHFRQLATQAPLPIAVFDATGTVESFNDCFVATFGHTIASVPTVDAFRQRVFPDESARRLAEQLWRGALTRDGVSAGDPVELAMRCADGTAKTVEMVCSRIGDKVVAILTDTTERKRSEQHLRESEERLNNLYSLSPVGIFLCTREGHYLGANQALADLLGYGSVAALLAGVDSLPRCTFHEPAEWNDIVHQLETEGKFANRLVQRHRKDGTPIWVIMNMRAVRDATGALSHFEGFTLDITERMQAAQALRDSEERLRTLINAMPDLVCFKDGHGRWLEANDFTCKLFGLGPHQYVGRTNRELAEVSPLIRGMGETFLTSDELAWHSGKMYRGEEALLDGQGSAVIFDTIKVPLFHPDGSRRGLLMVGRDITRQREASLALSQFNQKLESLVAERTAALEEKAAELEAANVRLVELDAVKSSFVSAVSHEVRTPLTSILGFVRLIERDFHKFYLPLAQDTPYLAGKGERIVANLQVIDREGERLKRLINDFLDLAKIEYGSLRWQDTRVSPNAIIAQVADAVQGMFAEHPDVRLRLDVAPQLPSLWLDPDRLQQVLFNLINNAVKFTPSGSITIRAYQPDERTLSIAVSDTGIGIAPEELERIFEKFHQVQRHDGTIDPCPGTGLGLTICRQIVEHYGGAIWAESEPGRGSTLHVALPVPQGKTSRSA